MYQSIVWSFVRCEFVAWTSTGCVGVGWAIVWKILDVVGSGGAPVGLDLGVWNTLNLTVGTSRNNTYYLVLLETCIVPVSVDYGFPCSVGLEIGLDCQIWNNNYRFPVACGWPDLDCLNPDRSNYQKGCKSSWFGTWYLRNLLGFVVELVSREAKKMKWCWWW